MAIWTAGLRPCFPVLGDDSIAEHNGEPSLGLGCVEEHCGVGDGCCWAAGVCALIV